MSGAIPLHADIHAPKSARANIPPMDLGKKLGLAKRGVWGGGYIGVPMRAPIFERADILLPGGSRGETEIRAPQGSRGLITGVDICARLLADSRVAAQF